MITSECPHIMWARDPARQERRYCYHCHERLADDPRVHIINTACFCPDCDNIACCDHCARFIETKPGTGWCALYEKNVSASSECDFYYCRQIVTGKKKPVLETPHPCPKCGYEMTHMTLGPSDDYYICVACERNLFNTSIVELARGELPIKSQLPGSGNPDENHRDENEKRTPGTSRDDGDQYTRNLEEELERLDARGTEAVQRLMGSKECTANAGAAIDLLDSYVTRLKAEIKLLHEDVDRGRAQYARLSELRFDENRLHEKTVAKLRREVDRLSK